MRRMFYTRDRPRLAGDARRRLTWRSHRPAPRERSSGTRAGYRWRSCPGATVEVKHIADGVVTSVTTSTLAPLPC